MLESTSALAIHKQSDLAAEENRNIISVSMGQESVGNLAQWF